MPDKTWSTELLPGEPVIFSVLHKDYVPERDYPLSSRESFAILNQASEPVFFVIDMSVLLLDLDDLTQAASMITDAAAGSVRHPNVREMVFVTPDALTDLALHGLESETFGSVNVRTFTTVEEAMAYVHSQL